MIPEIRAAFNNEFTEEKYQSYLQDLDRNHPGAIEFRIAETPVFVPKDFTNKMLDACESIVDHIMEPSFLELSNRAIPANVNVPGDNGHPHFIAFDFGVCENKQGELEPQLVELQGFPTLFAFQVFQPNAIRENFRIPGGFDCYLNGLDESAYIQLLTEIIIGQHAKEQVILLEIFPEKQKTRIDFYCTEDYLGIKTVSLTDIIQEGNQLYYINNGQKTRVKRIYNRIIFDDLQQQAPEVQEKGKFLLEDLDVEWVPHPNWFYRISKFTLPFIKHPYVPETWFLNEVKIIPPDLENYVLKPLFSFAGQGVIIDLTATDIGNVKDPENWILQRKVKYADVIKTPNMPAKAEIRIFYFWKSADERPVPANNLARMSKGKMIGVRYNKDKDWVGGTICFFEK